MGLYKPPYLEPYHGPASRHTCPACRKPRCFTLYLHGSTGLPIHPTVGRCNHEIHCGYHYPPRQYFLCDYFPRERIEEAMEHYALGATRDRRVIFWQMDIKGKPAHRQDDAVRSLHRQAPAKQSRRH